MTDFVGVDISTDSATLLDAAIQNINATMAANGLPGWTAQDADLAVLILGTIAEIAADNAVIASTLLAAAFRVFGTTLLGLPYNQGAPAMVSSTFAFTTAAPSGGYTIDTTTSVVIDNEAFYVADTVTTGTGDTSATVELVASDNGTAYNGLGGIGTVVPLGNEIDWVATVTLAAATSGGVDQQDDTNYQNDLAGVLQLMAPRPIIGTNYAAMVQSEYQLNATGITVGRATSIDNYYPASRTLGGGGSGPAALTAATTTNSTTTVAITAGPYPFAIPAVGATVTGTGIPSSTTVAASPAPTATSFTLSASATTSGSPTLTIGAWTNVERCVTTFVTAADGTALTATQMDAISAWLQGFREGTFLAFVEPPTYTLVYVSCTLKVLQGYVAATVSAQVQAALISILNPLTWGSNPTAQGSTSTWLNSSNGFTSIYQSVLVGTVMNTPGVQNVTALTLGTTSSPGSSADLTLTGAAPLPTSTTSSIVITAS